MSDLKPCPFCGSINLGTVPDDQGFSWTECLDCGAGGPDGDQSQRGVTWNTRTIPTVTDDLRWRVLDSERPNPGQWCIHTRTIHDALRCSQWDEENQKFWVDDPEGSKYWKPCPHIPDGFDGQDEHEWDRVRAALQEGEKG